jgi:hypothetical protein
MFYPRLFEKFTEDSDPIKDLGIGMPKVGDVIIAKSRLYLIKTSLYLAVDTIQSLYIEESSRWKILGISYHKKYIIIDMIAVDNSRLYQSDKFKLTYEQLKKYFKII